MIGQFRQFEKINENGRTKSIGWHGLVFVAMSSGGGPGSRACGHAHEDEGMAPGTPSRGAERTQSPPWDEPNCDCGHAHEDEGMAPVRVPNEPNDCRLDDSGGLGKLPNEPNGHRSDGSGGLGKLPNEPNGHRSDGSGGLGKLPNEPNGRGGFPRRPDRACDDPGHSSLGGFGAARDFNARGRPSNRRARRQLRPGPRRCGRPRRGGRRRTGGGGGGRRP